MNSWISFWTYFLVASLVLFAGLAVVVTIGGFFNIRSLFRSLAERAGRQAEGSGRRDDQGRAN